MNRALQPVIKHNCPEKERLFLVERVRLNAIENPNQLLPPLPTVVQLHPKPQAMIQTKIRKPSKGQVPTATATSSKSKIQMQGPTPTQGKVIQIQSNNSQSQVSLEQAQQKLKSFLLQSKIQIQGPTPNQGKVVQIQSNKSQSQVSLEQAQQKLKSTLVQMQARGKSQTQIHVNVEHDYTKNGETENFLQTKNLNQLIEEESNLDYLDDNDDM